MTSNVESVTMVFYHYELASLSPYLSGYCVYHKQHVWLMVLALEHVLPEHKHSGAMLGSTGRIALGLYNHY